MTHTGYIDSTTSPLTALGIALHDALVAHRQTAKEIGATGGYEVAARMLREADGAATIISQAIQTDTIDARQLLDFNAAFQTGTETRTS